MPATGCITPGESSLLPEALTTGAGELDEQAVNMLAVSGKSKKRFFIINPFSLFLFMFILLLLSSHQASVLFENRPS